MRASNRRVLNASARIDSQETRKVQLHCQPVSNAIPLGGVLSYIDFFLVESIEQDPDSSMGMREKRVVNARVRIPTVQLLEGLLNLIVSVQPQLDQIATVGNAYTQALATQIARFKAVKIERPSHD
jgi:hypothetical protein